MALAHDLAGQGSAARQPMPRSGPCDRAAVAQVIEVLTERFHNRVSTSDSVREQHGHTTTLLPNEKPDAVVFAHSTEEVAEIVRLCADNRIPVVPFGTGSSLEGHVNAPFGGISIDCSEMNAVLNVSPEDLDCVVQPGVTRKQLNEHLRDTGLFFPIDPGADASLGGMAATRASGTNAVRYGTMRDVVIALEAVMPDGEIIRTGRRAKKSSAGYDLTRLLIGSEGTLGIITELTLKLHGIPEVIAGGVIPFETVKGGCDTVIATIQCGVPMARIELLDALQVKACNAYSDLGLAEKPTLFVEFHGTHAHVEEQVAMFREIAEMHGGGTLDWATETEARTKLWQARHDAYWAALQLRPGARGISTDVCVPISKLADCIEETRREIDTLGLIAPIVGHVGDGNFHVLPLIDETDVDEIKSVQGFIERMVERALDMDGTCTGEHGIGQGKMKYLERELGSGIDIMRRIKSAIDPDDIMNPGKIVSLDP